MTTGEIIFKTSKGCITEDKIASVIRVYENGMACYDGCMDRFTTEVKINYKTGLFQRWAITGYQAWVDNSFKGNRDSAIEYGKSRVS